MTTEIEFGDWRAEGGRAAVEFSLTVLDEIRTAVVDAFLCFPHGGIEVGGVLFGQVREEGSTTVRILAYRPLECEHAEGPVFVLSAKDETALEDLLAASRKDPELEGMKAVGWYHSHTRSDIFLSEKDIEIYYRHFPAPWQIAMVLRPMRMRPTRVGFFLREEDGSVRAESSYRELIVGPRARLAADANQGVVEPEVRTPAAVGPVGTKQPAAMPPPGTAPPVAREREQERLKVPIEALPKPREAPPAPPPPAPEPGLRPPRRPVELPRQDPPEPEVRPTAATEPVERKQPPPMPVPRMAPAVARAGKEERLSEPVEAVPKPRIEPPAAPPPAPKSVLPPPLKSAELPLRPQEESQSKTTAKRKRTPWLPVLVLVLAVVGAIGLAVWNWWPQPLPAAPGMSFHALDSDGQLQLRWDPTSTAIRNADKAEIEITDGDHKVTLSLGAGDLRRGSFPYARTSGRVRARLSVTQPNGQTAEESTTFLGQPVGPATPSDLPPDKKPDSVPSRR